MKLKDYLKTTETPENKKFYYCVMMREGEEVFSIGSTDEYEALGDVYNYKNHWVEWNQEKRYGKVDEFKIVHNGEVLRTVKNQ